MKKCPKNPTPEWVKGAINRGITIFPARVLESFLKLHLSNYQLRPLTDEEWESGNFANKDTLILIKLR